MSGGLYRSAHARGEQPAALTQHQPDESVAEPPGTDPEPATGAAGNSAVMAVGSLVSRGTGFLRTLALTAALGTAVGDAYTTAQLFPGMVYELLLGGVLSSVLIPVLVRRRTHDPDAGQAYTQRLLTLATLALGVATLLAVVAAPLLTMLYAGQGTSGDFRQLVTALSLLMLPMLFFTGLSALTSAVLNTRGHFAAPMWTPILNNLVVIATAGLYIALFTARRLEPGEMTASRVLVLGGGTLLGVVVQAAGLLPALRRVGFRWRWRFDFGQLDLRELGRLGAWMFCYVGVSQLALVVLIRLLNEASGRKSAGPLIYNNVYLLLMMAHGIIAVSVITALLPRMSAAAAEGRYADVAADLSRGIRTVTAILAPVAVCYAVLATPITVTLFRYGAFRADDARATSVVLLVAAIALVPFSVSQLFTFAYYALADTKTPALINIPVVVLRLAVQIALVALVAASFAAPGAMIGNAVSYVAAAAASAWLLRRRIGLIGLRGISLAFAKVAAAAAGAAAAGAIAVRLVPVGDPLSRWDALLQLAAGGLVIGGSYLGLAVLFRIREVHQVLSLVRRKLGR
ncbi:MAG TPA: murein biosynthesis integral membrane protein MurJ [Pilimelia sp.]|nr:murein biosynthesis integral membrane protein MurJ [Pilimelia sp.]